MKRCKTCKWWDAEEGKEWGDCGIAGSTDGEPDVPDTKAYASDFEGYRAGLNTSIRFGCVQWEGKGAK